LAVISPCGDAGAAAATVAAARTDRGHRQESEHGMIFLELARRASFWMKKRISHESAFLLRFRGQPSPVEGHNRYCIAQNLPFKPRLHSFSQRPSAGTGDYNKGSTTEVGLSTPQIEALHNFCSRRDDGVLIVGCVHSCANRH
jgi:hypothetical protein